MISLLVVAVLLLVLFLVAISLSFVIDYFGLEDYFLLRDEWKLWDSFIDRYQDFKLVRNPYPSGNVRFTDGKYQAVVFNNGLCAIFVGEDGNEILLSSYISRKSRKFAELILLNNVREILGHEILRK